MRPVPPRRPKQGFVLVLVLGLLILITVLVIGFLAHATSESKSIASYRDQTSNLLLSDIAVSIVKAQIDDATGAGAATSPGIWASQPGAIRTISANGATQTTYKLYSCTALADTNTGSSLKTDILADIPTAADSADWNSSALWTDLNAPAVKSDGTFAYPIIDVVNDNADLPVGNSSAPSAAPFATGSFNIDNSASTNPIGASRAATGISPLPATSPLPMPVRWLYVLKNGQVIAPDASSTATQLTFNNASTKPVSTPNNPATDNPIVGRIAFWTDDDTCRVNINTAAFNANTNPFSATAPETFWDTPHFSAPDDLALAVYQPVNNEFQRYGGHPATTTLSLALPEFAPGGTSTTANAEALITLTPRYGTGGSVEGTAKSSGITGSITLNANRLLSSVDELLFDPPATAQGSRVPNTNGIAKNSIQLTKPQVETAKFFLTAHSRAPELNLFGLPRVAMWPVSSVNSAATRTATDQLIAFCSSTPVATGSAPNNYYFVRQPFTSMSNPNPVDNPLEGSNSTLWDVSLPSVSGASGYANKNTSLLSYLDTLTSQALPGNLGNGMTFGSTSSATPNATSKYGQLGLRQILTEIFDYIRITNSRDPGLDTVNNTSAPAGAMPYAAPTAYDANSTTKLTATQGYGQITPTQMTDAILNGWGGTYGFGRFQGILVGAQIMFMGVGQGPPVGSPQTYPAGSYQPVNSLNVFPYKSVGTGPEDDVEYATPSQAAASLNPLNPYTATTTDSPAGLAPAPLIPPPGSTAVEAVFCLTFFDPALGYARNTPWIHAATSGLTNFTISAVSSATLPVSQSLFLGELGSRIGVTANGGANIDYASMEGANPGSLGGLLDFRVMLASRYWTRGAGDQYFNGGHSTVLNMPTAGSFQFSGGTVTVAVSTAYGSTPYPVVHTYTLAFPAATLPVPGYSARPIMGTGTTFGDRFTGSISSSNSKDAGGYVSTFIDYANDTILSMVPNAAAGYGDYRMLAQPTPTTSTAPATSTFLPHPKYAANSLSQTDRIALDEMYPSGQVFQTSTSAITYPATTSSAPHGTLISGAAYQQNDTSEGVNLYSAAPVVPITQTAASAGSSSSSTGPPPDFDNGFGDLPDGPYINKPDEGGVYPTSATTTVYYNNLGGQVDTTQFPSYFFSPQRQVPSPVMFGSLPTGAPVTGTSASLPPAPWQTLLFQPGVDGSITGTVAHAGSKSPKDEYLLDLFWMPQVQPYAISEPFSTAGKVNLNYQILPFTYIDRSTALQSVLSSEKVAEVGLSLASSYKSYPTGGMTSSARFPLNLSEVDGTLSQFANTFSQFSFFNAAAEICDIYLVPLGQSWKADTTLGTNGIATNATAQTAFYNTGTGSLFSLVGDNTREKPYADIYSRITTKSNSFTVYYRVQTLKNTPGAANAAQWTEGQGAILGDFRGSTTLERYIDPTDTTIPDYATSPTSANLETHYKWRVVENSRFAP